jgi:hypothetical protein
MTPMMIFLLACDRDPPHARSVDADRATSPQTASLPVSAPPEGDPTSTAPSIDPPTELPTVEGEPLPLCINEFMPDTVVSVLDEDGEAADWIELHNPTGEDVALAGWAVTDDPADPRKHLLSDELVVESGGFLVLWADDQAERGPTHLGFALSDEGEAVALFAPTGDGSVVWFGPVGNDLAVGRVTDCCVTEGCFGYTFMGTPGSSNGAASLDSGQ